MRNIIYWKDRTLGETEFFIYRGDNPLDVNNLPTPIGIVGPDVTSYEDTTVVDGETYYYRVAAVYQGHEYLSEEMMKEVLGPDFPTAGLLSHWTMDNISGNTLVDEEGANNGIINGATVVAGKEGSALSFDGNDYVNLGTSILSGSLSEFSLSMWVKTTSEGTWFGKITTNSNSYILFRNNTITGGHFRVGSGGTGYDGVYFPPAALATLKDGTWHHVAATYGPANGMRLYLDGALEGERSGYGTLILDSYPARLGRDPRGSLGFTGQMDQARIYLRELTAQEITLLSYEFD